MAELAASDHQRLLEQLSHIVWHKCCDQFCRNLWHNCHLWGVGLMEGPITVDVGPRKAGPEGGRIESPLSRPDGRGAGGEGSLHCVRPSTLAVPASGHVVVSSAFLSTRCTISPLSLIHFHNVGSIVSSQDCKSNDRHNRPTRSV